MSEIEKGKKLFEEFPPISTSNWEDLLTKDLKGADYERTLVWKTNEGFNVRPYYRSEDLKKVDYLDKYPMEFPYIKGMKSGKNSWFIRQDIEVTDLAKANQKAQSLLTKGVDSLGFVLDKNKSFSKTDLAVLLNDIPLSSIEINFITGYESVALVNALVEYINAEQIDHQSVKGSITFDPLVCLAKTGKFHTADYMVDVTRMIKISADLPNFKVLTIRGDVFENAGSSIVQELGFSLAVANEYLANLTDNGFSIDQAAKSIKFVFATGSNYFMEIAKIRAARLLWATIVKQYQPKDSKSMVAQIHAVTSDWNKTVYDSYVNMLRTQTEAMSAVLGGVDSMTVKAFNSAYQKPDEFGERIARNQQMLLKEEAHFDKVIDPSAGSYYIETLTDSIAEQAWKIFVETEENGGFVAALKQGNVQAQINATAQKRDIDIANRKEIFLGVNQYPDFNEKLDKEMDESVFGSEPQNGTDVQPLKKYRGAQAFETLRYQTDTFSKTHKRPKAYMLTMGNVAMRKARAQFACNFFAVAGFEVVDNNGFETVDEAVKAARKAKADIVVICSSDDEYATLAPAIFQQLGNEALVVVAGYPKTILDELENAGIRYFIHVKSNVLETLREFQKALGI